jgi:signal transduction histidine kinase
VHLVVRDHGIGIPPERRARLFDRFYQAHGEGHFGGLGLGLFISRQIVELHGGTLEADFPPDGGTRFCVNLPGSDTRRLAA